MVKKIVQSKLLNGILLAQFCAAVGILYLNQNYIFFLITAIALLSRVVFGFFEANLAESELLRPNIKQIVGTTPLLVLFCLFFIWIFKVLVNTQTSFTPKQEGGVDDFFLRAPYLLISIVFLIGVTAIASGGILRGYRKK